MADEAAIKIVIVDDGAGGSSIGGGSRGRVGGGGGSGASGMPGDSGAGRDVRASEQRASDSATKVNREIERANATINKIRENIIGSLAGMVGLGGVFRSIRDALAAMRDYREAQDVLRRGGESATGAGLGGLSGGAATAGAFYAGRGGRSNGPGGPSGGGDGGGGGTSLVPSGGGTSLVSRTLATTPIRNMIGGSEPWSSAVAGSIMSRTSAGAATESATGAGIGTALASAARPAAIALGVTAGAAALAAGALIALNKVVHSSTQGYEELNAKIAAGRAQNEVRRLYGDMNRAAIIADNLNRFEKSATQIEQTVKDATNALLNVILGAVNGPIETIAEIMQVIAQEFGAVNPADAAQVLQGRMEEFLGMKPGVMGVIPANFGRPPNPANVAIGKAAAIAIKGGMGPLAIPGFGKAFINGGLGPFGVFLP